MNCVFTLIRQVEDELSKLLVMALILVFRWALELDFRGLFSVERFQLRKMALRELLSQGIEPRIGPSGRRVESDLHMLGIFVRDRFAFADELLVGIVDDVIERNVVVFVEDLIPFVNKMHEVDDHASDGVKRDFRWIPLNAVVPELFVVNNSVPGVYQPDRTSPGLPIVRIVFGHGGLLMVIMHRVTIVGTAATNC